MKREDRKKLAVAAMLHRHPEMQTDTSTLSTVVTVRDARRNIAKGTRKEPLIFLDFATSSFWVQDIDYRYRGDYASMPEWLRYFGLVLYSGVKDECGYYVADKAYVRPYCKKGRDTIRRNIDWMALGHRGAKRIQHSESLQKLLESVDLELVLTTVGAVIVGKQRPSPGVIQGGPDGCGY